MSGHELMAGATGLHSNWSHEGDVQSGKQKSCIGMWRYHMTIFGAHGLGGVVLRSKQKS